MYLGIDIGGTKTLVASLNENGVTQHQERFESSQEYSKFLSTLGDCLHSFGETTWEGAAAGVPAPIDYESGSVPELANLKWANVSLRVDLSQLVGREVLIENDANLAGLSEAMLVKDRYSNVLYITISTGIGTGIITNQEINRQLVNAEAGHTFLQYEGKLVEWEHFASGKAIYQKYNMYARDITDEAAWRDIAQNIGLGILPLESILQPEVIIIGGSIGTHFPNYQAYLREFLDTYSTAQVPARPVVQAQRPEDAVIFGCFDLASTQGK